MSSVEQDIVLSKSYPTKIPFKTLQWSLAVGLPSQLSREFAGEHVAIGTSVQLGKNGKPQRIAFSSPSKAVLVHFPQELIPKTGPTSPPRLCLHKFLADRVRPLAGVNMARLALHIKQAFKEDVIGIDLLTTKPNREKGPWDPGSCLQDAVPGVDAHLVNQFRVNALWHSCVGQDDRTLLLRAWVSSCVANGWADRVELVAWVSTSCLSPKEFHSIRSMVAEVDLMEAAQPVDVHNDFSHVERQKKDNVVIHNSRFSTRVRRSNTAKVVFTDHDGKHHYATAVRANGKQTLAPVPRRLNVDNVQTIRVIGKVEPNGAEVSRERFLLSVLQQEQSLEEHALIQHLWFPKRTAKFKPRRTAPQVEKLNNSQSVVVRAMTDHGTPFTVVHGPPGTGKTSTITAAVKVWSAGNKPVWLVAQSNVGVLNIGKKCYEKEIPFLLIVSKEFFYQWHEPIYGEIMASDSIIRSDELPDKAEAAESIFGKVKVILCTLSMLSNPALQDCDIFKYVPLHRLVVDEASQIGVYEYMHVFARFPKLEKVCFFGDPMQLPPFGKDEAPTLQSIYDFKHLKDSAYLLDTQYRMPTQLGDFISKAVYGSKLYSDHPIKDVGCIAFIDVNVGVEEHAGKSKKNMAEVKTIVQLVRNYYQNKKFCIITPYDGQRSAIQAALKREGLPSEQVFNVDSFQGNEEDYVLVSVVRTEAPGFLKSLNRVNVMLTRCKKGMVIVTQRAFLSRKNVQSTLMGKMVLHWKGLKPAGGPSVWTNWKAVMNRHCSLPGAPGTNASAPGLYSDAESDDAPDETPLAVAAQFAGIPRASVAALPSVAQIHVATTQQQLARLQLNAAIAQVALASSSQNISANGLRVRANTSSSSNVSLQAHHTRKRNKGKGKA